MHLGFGLGSQYVWDPENVSPPRNVGYLYPIFWDLTDDIRPFASHAKSQWCLGRVIMIVMKRATGGTHRGCHYSDASVKIPNHIGTSIGKI